MTVERRLTERRGAIVDEAAVAAWLGDMDRRAAGRRTPVVRLSLTLLDPAPDRASRSGVPDLAPMRAGMGIRGVTGEPRLGRQSEALDRMGVEPSARPEPVSPHRLRSATAAP